MAVTRTALVSGANRGIGFEIVRQLARLGVLAVIGARDPNDGLAAAEKLKPEGLDIPVVALDVDREGSAAEAVAEVKRLYGRLDILVNNAAILIDAPGGFKASLFDLTADTLRRTMETNLLGPIRLPSCESRSTGASSISRRGPASSATWGAAIRPTACRRRPSMR